MLPPDYLINRIGPVTDLYGDLKDHTTWQGRVFHWKEKDTGLQTPGDGGIINNMDMETIQSSPKASPVRYPVTQEQIDEILENELKEFNFPVKPVYNPRIRDNGRAIGEFYSWKQFKRIKSIEIRKQDSPDRRFLIDTLLHEYYEAEIMSRQYTDKFYEKLSRARDDERHAWINMKINEFFNKSEGKT